jgi:HK97 family phage major capsid protein
VSDQEELKRKVERYNKIYNEMQDIQRRSEEEKRDWSAEEKLHWDQANKDITELELDIDRLQRAVELGKKHAELDTVDWSKAIRGASEMDTPEVSSEVAEKQKEDAYQRAFSNYMRFGRDNLDMEERKLLMANRVDSVENRAQGTAPATAGGYFIPPGYRQVITEVLKAYGGMLNLANVITTSTGNPLQWPVNDDTMNVGAILAENTGVTQQDVTLGTRNLGAYMYTSKLILASLQILQDSVFNLDQWLPTRLGVRLGRAIAAHLIAGSGTGQPLGVATNAVVGATGTGTSAITYDNLVDLEHSVDPAYRAHPGCTLVMHDLTLAVLRKLKDGYGRPIWLPTPTAGFPATLNGLTYTIDQGMATPGASAKSILFGDFKAGYIVRQVLDMQMVRFGERYMDALQVGFMGFMRLDATVDDPNAFKAFVHAAT